MGFFGSYPESDLGELITEAQACQRNESRAMDEIVRRFEGLTRKIGRQVAYGRFHRPDVENAARFGLTHAVQRHRGSVRTFPAYARLYMTGAARREVARWWSPDEVYEVELHGSLPSAAMTTAPIQELVDHTSWGYGDVADAIASLLPSQQHLLSCRYGYDADLAELARDAGTSVSAVSQRLSTAHRRLRSALDA